MHPRAPVGATQLKPCACRPSGQMLLALIPAALLVLVATVAGVRLRALAAERDRLTAEVSTLRASVTALEATAGELRAGEAAYRGLVEEASDWVWAADHV